MMEEVEAVTGGVQREDIVLHQMADHLHVALMDGHQMADHLPAAQMADHQVVVAVLHEQETADHLQPAMAEPATADQRVHQVEDANHQAAEVDVKKVVLPTDKFSPDCAN